MHTAAQLTANGTIDFRCENYSESLSFVDIAEKQEIKTIDENKKVTVTMAFLDVKIKLIQSLFSGRNRLVNYMRKIMMTIVTYCIFAAVDRSVGPELFSYIWC